VNIAGLYVTDTLPDPLKYMIPDTKPAATTIPAKGFIVLWTDGTPVQGPQHLSFKLSASGEAIGIAQIYRDEVNKIDGLTFTAQSTDISYGRCPDGGSSFINYMKPTIGFSNVCNPYVEQITNDGSKSSIKAEPNPFREAENINVNIYEPSDCSIIIYNSEGKKIKTIVKQYLNKGNYSFRWNGCNDSGAAVPEGLYLLMLSSGNNARSVKIIKTK
jgi:hypothetical protein